MKGVRLERYPLDHRNPRREMSKRNWMITAQPVRQSAPLAKVEDRKHFISFSSFIADKGCCSVWAFLAQKEFRRVSSFSEISGSEEEHTSRLS